MRRFSFFTIIFPLSFFFILAVSFFLYVPVYASETNGTINASFKYAKLCENTDCSSYTQINFKTTNGTPIHITDNEVTGNAWSEKLGWINLNPSSAGVTNTEEGELGGYAWGDAASWINFAPTNGGVEITNDGEFDGWAWVSGAGGGWIKFDCTDPDACIKTDWRPESARGGGGSSDGGGSIITPTNPTNPTNPIDPGTPTNPTNPDNPTNTNPTNTTNPQNPENPTHPTEPENPDNPSIPNNSDTNIIDEVRNTFNNTATIISAAIQEIRSVLETPAVSIATKIAVVGGIVAGAVSAALPIIFATPFSFQEIGLLPLRIWAFFIDLLGFKRRRRPWGTVYDSVTKQPLDPVVVVLKNEKGEDVSTSITDLDGRYGFLVQPGMYTLTANRTNYIFPSQKLFGKNNDELYSDLYFGGPILVRQEGDVIAKHIPLDPIKEDWNEQAKVKQHLMSFYTRREKILQHFADAFFNVGFIIAIIAFIVSRTPYNVIIFALYIAGALVRHKSIKSRVPLGGVMYKESGYPMCFAIIRVFSTETNTEVLHKITDKTGRFYLLVRNGNYYVTIEKKNSDATYTKIFTSAPFEVSKGYIDTMFEI